MMFKVARGFGRVDKEDFLTRDDAGTRGHEHGTRMRRYIEIQLPKWNYSYYNSLEADVAREKNIRELKIELDEVDMITGQHEPQSSRLQYNQIDKYTRRLPITPAPPSSSFPPAGRLL